MLEHGLPSELAAAKEELSRAAELAEEIGRIDLLPKNFELRARTENDRTARESALRAALDIYERMAAPLQVERVTALI